MKYRAEIDGLRAIAVLPVIFFHAGFDFFGGGFVGVDVFFVISGYLITFILVEDLENDRFSILQFYERRARRILPALFFVIFCTLPFAWLWMMPRDILNFAQSLGAVSFFVSNFYFLIESGYFGPTAEEMPLLHTWSLAVEEQFYVIFPILLLSIWRLGRHGVFWFIVIAAAMSFALSEWMSRSHPIANFFITPTRAWELFAGSLCALVVNEHGVKRSEFLAGTGLLAILVSFFVFDESTPTPSIYAVLPVGGTMLILLFGDRSTAASRMLSLKVIVGTGLISYSAYLWHQPLFAFARLRSLSDPSAELLLILSAASLLLAYFSWRFVEKPFRRQRGAILTSRFKVFFGSGVGLIAIFGVGIIVALQDGMPWRFQGSVLNALQAKSQKAPGKCHFNKDREFEAPVPECLHSVDQPFGRVLFLGDSHATAISNEIYPDLNNIGLNVYHTSFTGCISLSGFKIYNRREYHPCSEFVEFVERYAIESGIDTIVLIARFPMYYWGRGFDNGEGGVEHKKPSAWDVIGRSRSQWDSDARRERLLNGMRDRIVALSEKFNVVLVAPIPEAGWNVPDYLAKQIFYGDDGSDTLSTSFDLYLTRASPILELFGGLEKHHENIVFAPIHTALCSVETGRCLNAQDGDVYYYDNDHLSNSGAKLVNPLIAQAILSVVRK